MVGVGTATFYGLNTLPTIYGSARKGIKLSDFDAVASEDKLSFDVEIGQLGEGIIQGEIVHTVANWGKMTGKTRVSYNIITRPFLHYDDDTTFDTQKLRFNTLLNDYKYIFLRISDYLYSVNGAVISDTLLIPIYITSIEAETAPNEKVFTINVEHCITGYR